MTIVLTEGKHTGEFLLDADEISFDQVTVTQGGTALAAGTVMSKLTATGKWVPYDDVGTDGSEVASGILYANLPVATGDVKATMVTRLAEVKGVSLVGATGNFAADLALNNIIVR